MIFIKNLKIFTVNVNCKYHWAKLPKMIQIMQESFLRFPCFANLEGANLRGANLRGAKNKTEKLTIIDFCIFERFGSQNRTTYFYNTKEAGIVVQCGCFYGPLTAFKKQVKETHGDNKHAKCYLQMAKLAKLRLEEQQ